MNKYKQIVKMTIKLQGKIVKTTTKMSYKQSKMLKLNKLTQTEL